MPWFMVPVIGAVFVCWAYAMVLAVLALLDIRSYRDEVWTEAGTRKAVWIVALLGVPFISGAAYWSRVRPALDQRADPAQRRPVPLLARNPLRGYLS
jgi:hypothetical protein